MSDKVFFPLLFFSLAILSACNNGGRKSDIRDTTDVSVDTAKASENQSLCFEHLEGSRNQDTTLVYLEIKGNDVSGKMISIPFEKDARKGTITGTKNNDVIKGVWAFMQEGMEDTISVEFKLKNKTLLQKEYSVDKHSGRQILKNTPGFTILYQPSDCLIIDKKF